MAREEEVMLIIQQLTILDDKTVGDIMASRGVWTAGQSARTNSGKALKNLAELRKVERCDGFYRLPGCKSEYAEHARLLTQILAELIKSYQAVIKREHTIPDKGLRPDAICLITHDNFGLCLIIEAMHNETEEYFQKKAHIWESWEDSLGYLSHLFGYKIPHFDIVAVKSPHEIITHIKEMT
jgi:hypothetical protein